MIKNFDLSRIKVVLLGLIALFSLPVTEIFAQARRVSVSTQSKSDDYTWWYILGSVLVIGLLTILLMRLRKKETEKTIAVKAQTPKQNNKVLESVSLDAEREMEWLRKNQNLIDKKRKINREKKKTSMDSLDASDVAARNSNLASINIKKNDSDLAGEESLPVFSFQTISPAKSFSPLMLSNDEALLSAIEQAYDEYEEDVEVRELSVRILSAFKTRNSIEALSQVALYDLSSGIRSKAVLTLTEFDHESVFEGILLACADPSREVRAAAARGLTRLSFDRADAWARIVETGETGRIRQAARAAMESGFVERSFERLVHRDPHYAYEAFVLLALLVKADETEPIFKALKTHRDVRVQKAILHLLKVTKNENALNELYSLFDDKSLSEEIRTEIGKVIEETALAAA